MPRLTLFLAVASLLLSAAIFGFFYAWVCSTIWGLDTLSPDIAIPAMQAMNASVRNAVFAPAFFATPFALLATGALAFIGRKRHAAAGFGLGGLVYLLGGLVLTISVNVPMNIALAEIALPLDAGEAARIWEAYSARWQTFNLIRTVFSGLSFLSGLYGFWHLKDLRPI